MKTFLIKIKPVSVLVSIFLLLNLTSSALASPVISLISITHQALEGQIQNVAKSRSLNRGDFSGIQNVGVQDWEKESHVAATSHNDSLVCVCHCQYKDKLNIRVPSYFEAERSSSCEQMDGYACLATHRGKSFRGSTRNCEQGLKPVEGFITPGAPTILK